MAYSQGAAPIEIWTPADPFPHWFSQLPILEAHGALFELSIWKNVGVKKYGFPRMPDDQWECSMARAAFRALPLSLDTLGKVLKLPIQKDSEGAKAMRKICKPDRDGNRLNEDEYPELYVSTYSYCKDDVGTEILASRYCGPIPDEEHRNWGLDLKMQIRGIRIDQELCRSAIDVATRYSRVLTKEFVELTGGAVQTVGQRDKLIAWCADRGEFLPDMTADTVDAYIAGCQSGTVRRVLEIRRYLSRSSHKKYARALGCIARDGRVHGATQYYGATTGRNVGRLFHPLNMRRPQFYGDSKLLDDAIKTRDLDFIEMVGGANVMEVLADAVRGMIIPAEKHEFIAGDYASIESVVTAGLAGDEAKLDVFRSGADPYCWFASKVVGHEVTKAEHPVIRQKVGKPGELAFGFAGGVGAWRKFSDDDRTDAEVEIIKETWRDAHPRIVDMWNKLDACAMNAVLHPGEAFWYNVGGEEFCRIGFVRKGDFLLIELPSGRRLHYFKPSVKETMMPWRDRNDNPVFKPQVHYWTTSDGRWQRVRGWRGQWTENIVQATARDLLMEGWRNLERANYPVVLTVYDECLTEVPVDWGSAEEVASCMMNIKAPYARDWPISCEAWRGGRYCKA